MRRRAGRVVASIGKGGLCSQCERRAARSPLPCVAPGRSAWHAGQSCRSRYAAGGLTPTRGVRLACAFFRPVFDSSPQARGGFVRAGTAGGQAWLLAGLGDDAVGELAQADAMAAPADLDSTNFYRSMRIQQVACAGCDSADRDADADRFVFVRGGWRGGVGDDASLPPRPAHVRPRRAIQADARRADCVRDRLDRRQPDVLPTKLARDQQQQQVVAAVSPPTARSVPGLERRGHHTALVPVVQLGWRESGQLGGIPGRKNGNARTG
jgi:hypothetical protein